MNPIETFVTCVARLVTIVAAITAKAGTQSQVLARQKLAILDHPLTDDEMADLADFPHPNNIGNVLALVEYIETLTEYAESVREGHTLTLARDTNSDDLEALRAEYADVRAKVDALLATADVFGVEYPTDVEIPNLPGKRKASTSADYASLTAIYSLQRPGLESRPLGVSTQKHSQMAFVHGADMTHTENSPTNKGKGVTADEFSKYLASQGFSDTGEWKLTGKSGTVYTRVIQATEATEATETVEAETVEA